jgi:hypothetical protein
MARPGSPQFRITPQVVLGMLIVLFGLSATADNLEWIEADRLWQYWPLVIVGFGLVKFLQAETRSAHAFALAVMGVGGLIAAQTVWGLRFDLWSLFPLVFVAVGLMIVVRAWRGPGQAPEVPAGDVLSPGGRPLATTTGNAFSEFAFWSGINRRVTSPSFRRADLTAIMGGIELDLRPAGTATGEAVIDVFVWWGGVEITVPPDWAVTNEVFAVMGAAEDGSTGGQDARHRLIVRGFVIMGGVEIKTT